MAANKLLRPAGTWFVKPSDNAASRKWLYPTQRIKHVEVITAATRKPNDPGITKCVKCGVEVNPGMTHQARVYTGDITLSVERTRLASIHPTAQYEEYTDKIKLPKFTTGHVCHDCAGDYSSVTLEHKNGTTETFQRVTTFPRPVAVVRDEIEGSRSYKGFSSRMKVRGNTGSRHKSDTYFK